MYKGQTQDLKNRLEEHNLGKTKSTKGFIPWELVYFEQFNSRGEVFLREKYFKTGQGRDFIKKVINNK